MRTFSKLLTAILLLIPAALFAEGWDSNLYKQIEQSIKAPEIGNTEYVITKYGAKTDATAAKNQKAIQKTIDLCSKKGGGKVIVPAGQHFLTGAIHLKSHVNLVIEEGAVLEFVFQTELYPIVETSWEGLDCFNFSPCIYAFKQTDIALTGKGTVDGGGSNETWWPWCGNPRFGFHDGLVAQNQGGRARLLKNGEDGEPMFTDNGERNPQRVFGYKDGLRPQLVNFNQCERVLLEDVTLLRSPFWVIHPLKSTDITVRRVKMINDGPNGDGCDPESCDRVLIENCFFNTGDDCIAIKSGRNRDGRERGMASKNIIIRNCEMKNGHGGVVIGSEISGGCQNVFAHDCLMDSPELERVVRIKTNSCRGGIIENINARDITVGTCKESVLKINLDYEHNEICCRGNYPIVRNVNIENITSQKSQYGVQIIGLEEDTYVYDINVKNCRFNGVRDGNSITGKTRNVVFDNLYVNDQLSLYEMPYKNYSQWMTYSEMKRQPKSYLLDFSTKPKWSYVMGIELEGMLDTYLRYGDEAIRQYCQEYTDTMINAQGEIRGYKLLDYNLDNIRTGHFVTRMYQNWPEAKNLVAMKTMMKQLEKQPRTKADKVYWHKAIYAYQVWLDGIFMGLPFYALTARDLLPAKKAAKIYDDAVNQISITYQRTLDPVTGLNRHAYDENRDMFWSDNETGLSQHCWARAQGWYTMALIELLDALPEDYARRQEVIDLLQKDLDAVIKWQDKQTGLWYQVMDSPEREGNYLEATASSMFSYVLLKAFNKGYLGAKYRDAGVKAYQGIIRNLIRINPDKTISLTNCCSVAGLGPGMSPAVKKAAPNVKENKRRDGSYSYYLSEPIRDNDAKGIGPFIWASLEMESMGYTTDNVLKKINRKAVVSRNNPTLSEANTLASLTVGNGHFATTVDITGLQSYPFEYGAGVPLTAMSDWAWHKFENTSGLQPEETQRTYDLGHGHNEVYAVEYKSQADGRHHEATQYFRINPHRLNLGTVGLAMRHADGSEVKLSELKDIKQEQKLLDGVIESHFEADRQTVDVTTAVMPDQDALLCRVKSSMLSSGLATIAMQFAYPTGGHADPAADYTKPEKHSSELIATAPGSAVIRRTIDNTIYYVTVRWQGDASIEQCDAHHFELVSNEDVITFEVNYTKDRPAALQPMIYEQQLKAVMKWWGAYWRRGAIADFSLCTDPRAAELERRVVLSQYLTQVNCAGNMPPQETGLTYNSWYGRPHLEMAWWHLTDFALWGRPQTVAQSLAWYNDTAFNLALDIAKRQGFKGARWMKMTDPWGGEAPSNTGSFLIWQQPHYIYLAEEMYRAEPNAETLSKYSQQVEATAEFMADFVNKVPKGKNGHCYILRGATAMQEGMTKDFSYNHPFELAYWQYGLSVAQKWRERMGKERNKQWDDIITHLATLPENDSIYTAGLPIKPFNNSVKSLDFDPFTPQEQSGSKEISEQDFLLKSRSDHPAVLGACGLLPMSAEHQLYDLDKMRTTLRWVLNNWNLATTWGWDYGMMAMAAARLGEPELALDVLLIDTQKNTYLPNGHNFQTPDRLRLYLPGNGALLTAVAMMCAGWEGSTYGNNPGFPKNGQWNVRWEGLVPMQ